MRSVYVQMQAWKDTHLEPQFRFWGQTSKFQVVCPQNGTAVLKGLKVMAYLSTYIFGEREVRTSLIRVDEPWVKPRCRDGEGQKPVAVTGRSQLCCYHIPGTLMAPSSYFISVHLHQHIISLSSWRLLPNLYCSHW